MFARIYASRNAFLVAGIAAVLTFLALWWLGKRPYGKAADCMTALKQLCAQRGDGNPPMCLHGPDRGTVSSTILSLPWKWPGGQYLHANGPPDRTPYDDHSHLLGQLAAGRGR